MVMGRSIGHGYYALRFAVLKRDGFTCQYCGQQAPNVKLEADHIVSVEDGGADSLENLCTSCYACNRGRSGLHIQLTRTGRSSVVGGPPSYRRDTVLEVLRARPEGTLPAMLSDNLGMGQNNTYQVLSRLRRKGLAEKRKGLWYIRELEPEG